jgi:hypothetical protein
MSDADRATCARCNPKACDSVDEAKAKMKIILFWLSIGMFSLSGVVIVGIAVHFSLWLRWRHGVLVKIKLAANDAMTDLTIRSNRSLLGAAEMHLHSRRTSAMSTFSQPRSIYSTTKRPSVAGVWPMKMDPSAIFMDKAPQSPTQSRMGTFRRDGALDAARKLDEREESKEKGRDSQN